MSSKKVFIGDFFAVDTDAYNFIDVEKCSEESIFEKAREIKAAHDIDQAALDLDAYYRKHDLLGCGKVVVNPAFQGRLLRAIEANCYDVNSMYPRVNAPNAGHHRPLLGKSER